MIKSKPKSSRKRAVIKPAAKSPAKTAAKKKPAKDKPASAEAALSATGMAFPEVTEDFPWGHRTLKVKGKAFIFMSMKTAPSAYP